MLACTNVFIKGSRNASSRAPSRRDSHSASPDGPVKNDMTDDEGYEVISRQIRGGHRGKRGRQHTEGTSRDVDARARARASGVVCPKRVSPIRESRKKSARFLAFSVLLYFHRSKGVALRPRAGRSRSQRWRRFTPLRDTCAATPKSSALGRRSGAFVLWKPSWKHRRVGETGWSRN